jgi:sugar lactone lactonase YvrE
MRFVSCSSRQRTSLHTRAQNRQALGCNLGNNQYAEWRQPAPLQYQNWEPGTNRTLEGKHVFNDLALSTTGVVYVSDTSEGSIYQLNTQSNTLRRVAPEHTFTAANGIAISPDERMIYVSAWGDGIDMIDLRSGSVKPGL